MTTTRERPRTSEKKIEGIGARVLRKEDPSFLTGRRHYVADLKLPGLLQAAIFRSPHAHARVVSLKVEEARRHQGVVEVLTFQEIRDLARPIPIRLGYMASLEPYLQYPLASDKVRYVGEPLAVVVAESRYVAEDALGMIQAEFAPLPAVTDAREALKPGAPLVHEASGSNLAGRFVVEVGDVEAAFRNADVVLAEEFQVQRHTGIPMETRGLVARFDAGPQRLTVWGPTKVPHHNRAILASMCRLSESAIHFIEPDVGGGFGVRGEFYPEDFLIPYAAIRTGRPVQWIEDRMEHLAAANHSREQTWEVQMAARRDGTVLGIQARLYHDTGGYIRTHGALVPARSASLFLGPYKIRHYRCEAHCVITNKTPAGTYRAPGRFEGNFVRERLMDLLAQRLSLDPAEIRYRNFISSEEMPYDTGAVVLDIPTVYDSGHYASALEKALEAAGYEEARVQQEERAKAGGNKALGIGIACFVEKSGSGPFEYARVALDSNGRVGIHSGITTLGQGHETTLAQICAEVLQVRVDDVDLTHGDTDLIPAGMGTFASRTAVMAGNAVYLAASKLKAQLLEAGAKHLGISPERCLWRDGKIWTGEKGPVLTLGELATALGRSPEGAALEASCTFENRHFTYPYGAHVAVVEVDTETGVVRPLRYVAAFDVGRAINPLIVEGQILGGIAQGIGGALLEELVYDREGQLLTTTLMDYLLPTTAEMPDMKIIVLEEAPSPSNPLGVKGAGEGGTAGAGAAIANAVADALRPLGAEIHALPLSPNRVLSAIWTAQASKPATKE